jgi:hypothetical protein
MEVKRIFRADCPTGVIINAKDFDPSIHREWVEPVPELPQTVEIAGLQEAIAPPPVPHPHKKTSKKKVIADDLAIS